MKRFESITSGPWQRSDGYIYEGACSGKWYTTRDRELVKAKLGTPITALGFAKWYPIHLRIYYLDDQNRITEYCWTREEWEWERMIPSPSMAANTRLACYGWTVGESATGGAHHINIFYQKSDTVLSTISYDERSNNWIAAEVGFLWGHPRILPRR
jgi:hypothetical protein